MSTRQQPTYDDATTTSTRTTPTTTDFSTTTTDPGTRSERTTSASDAPTPHDDVPWTQRCTRQFDTTDDSRMRNLNDDANAAMHDGV